MQHSVTPLVFRTHTRDTVTVTLTETGAAFAAGEYFASVVPAYSFWITGQNEAQRSEPIPCRVQDGILCFSYSFAEEQEYGIKIFYRDWQHNVLKTSVFAVNEDLFCVKPMLADFHVHTTFSDGKQTPGEVCAAYCRAGFEAIAITDHFTMEGSRAARARFEGMPLPLEIYYGEEVHCCQKNHLLNFGVNESVNEWFRANEAEVYAQVNERAAQLGVPDGVDRIETAALLIMAEKLRANDGLSVFAHPFWRSNAYHLDPHTARYALSQHLFDAYELLGGHGVHENNMQLAFWTDLLQSGVHMPVLGCSDSHTVHNHELFENMKTIVFAENNAFPAVKRAILDERTVAAYQYPGEEPRLFGAFRLVAYVGFLMQYYFPGLRRAAADCAALMEKHCAEPVCAERFGVAAQVVRQYYIAAFGRQENGHETSAPTA